VLVTRDGAAELARIVTVDRDAPLVDGTVMGMDGDQLLLSVAVGQRQEGFVSASLNQTVRVPKGEILSFQRREVDRLKTAFFVGGSVAVVTAVVALIVNPFGTTGPNPNDPPDELFFRFNVFSVRVGR
jgi:hypothetical protein